MARLFGTDGVRGIANTELSCDLAFRLGQASAYVLASDVHRPTILVGRDTRLSGEMLESALVSRSGQPVVSAQARVLAQERTGGELYQGVVCMKTALEYLQSNVSPAAVCGYLEWALR